MSYAAGWFLVMISTGQYIGPLHQPACQAAADSLRGDAVVCRQANSMAVCGVDGLPGTFTACPVFDIPKVMVKP